MTAALAFERVSWRQVGRLILDDVTFTLEAGSSLALVGPSGSGKSSLIGIALGLIEPSSGEVRVGGELMTGLRPRARAELRRRSVTAVFQSGELIDEVTGLENVLIGGLLAGMSRTDAHAKATSVAAELGLAGVIDQPAWTLSGGERQRVAVARALIPGPACLLADEPTASLDANSRAAVATSMLDAAKSCKIALLVATHDDALAGMCDARMVLTGGRLGRSAETSAVAR